MKSVKVLPNVASSEGSPKIAPAGRSQMQADRRRRLVEATIYAIHQYGFAETTVSKIAAIAGISAGNVHHYFGGKDGLLEEAMRTQLDAVRTEAVQRLRAVTTPMERLRAIIESNFVPSVFSPEVCTAWLHFVAHATHNERLRRLSRINGRRLRSNLIAPLKMLVGPTVAISMADALIAMIDGIWMHRALGDSSDGAVQSVLDYLEHRMEQEKARSA